MFRRHHASAALPAVAVSLVLAAGCSSNTPATPRVTFESVVEHGTHTTADCPETGTWFTIGSFGNPSAGTNPDGTPADPVRPIDDGGSDQQGTASVTCSVVPEGDGYRVGATAQLTGATGGYFKIEGLFRATGDQTGISVSVAKQGRTYIENDCVAQYTLPNMTVAAGRVWASVSCPNATAASLQRTCSATATFRFENCGQ